MKTIILKLAIIIIVCAISACQDDSILDAATEKGIDKTILHDAISRSIDDEEMLYRLQTDHIGMLINSIQKVDSTYVLTISQDDAKELGIPDSTYSLVQSITANYNLNISN